MADSGLGANGAGGGAGSGAGAVPVPTPASYPDALRRQVLDRFGQGGLALPHAHCKYVLKKQYPFTLSFGSSEKIVSGLSMEEQLDDFLQAAAPPERENDLLAQLASGGLPLDAGMVARIKLGAWNTLPHGNFSALWDYDFLAAALWGPDVRPQAPLPDPLPGLALPLLSIALGSGWAITVDEGASCAQSVALVLEPGAPRASPLKLLGASVTFEGGLAPLQVVAEAAHPYTIRRRIDGTEDFLVLDVPGGGDPASAWEGLQWFPYNGQQYTLVPLGQQPGAGAAAPLAVGAQCILLFQKDSAIALSPDAAGLCLVRFNAKSPATTPLPARALWRVAQCDAATGLPASFTCLGRRFSGHTLAHCRGEGLHGPTPVTLDDTLPHPMRPLPVVCPGKSEVFESDRRKIVRLWGHLSGTGEEPLKGSPDELSAGAMLSSKHPAPGVAFPESALLRTDFAPALPVLMVRKLEGAAPPSLHDIVVHCKDIVSALGKLLRVIAPNLPTHTHTLNIPPCFSPVYVCYRCAVWRP